MGQSGPGELSRAGEEGRTGARAGRLLKEEEEEEDVRATDEEERDMAAAGGTD